MNKDTTPWYKQFWPWFILSPLLIVICAGFWMLYMAIVTNDGVIVDNFYKDGLGIEVRTEQDALARNLGLNANLDWSSQQLRLQLRGVNTGYPNQLSLLVVFPTKSSRDVEIVLAHQGAGIYTGKIPEPITGKRQLQLQPIVDTDEAQWRLHAQVELPLFSGSVELLPKPQ